MQVPDYNPRFTPQQPNLGGANPAAAPKESPPVVDLSSVKESVCKLFESVPAAVKENSDSSFKEFVQLHCSAKIEGTSYEGSSQLDKYGYWKGILFSAKARGAISEGDYDILMKPICDGEAYFHCMNHRDTDVQKSALHKTVLAALEKEGSFYIPSGWAGVPAGHATITKFFLDRQKNEVRVTIFNRGMGLNYHELSRIDGSKEKRDFRSTTAVIPLDEFKESQGKRLITAMLQLQSLHRQVVSRI
jgi:hypothetical protein